MISDGRTPIASRWLAQYADSERPILRRSRLGVIELLRLSRGRPSHLSEAEREEFSPLAAKAEPRQSPAEVAEKLSPVRLLRQLVEGRRKR